MLSLFRRAPKKDKEDDDRIDDEPGGPTAGHSGSIICALFLLIFAIAVIVPWTVADSARQNTYAETQALVEVYWASGDLPAADADRVRKGLRDYTRYVAETEWADLAEGELSPAAWARLDALRTTLDDLSYTPKEQKDALAAAETQLETVYAARRQRAVDAQATLPPGVLTLTVVTGALVLLYPLIAGAKPRGIVWVPYLLMIVCLGFAIYLAFAINHTFTGPLGVGPEAFDTALVEFARVP